MIDTKVSRLESRSHKAARTRRSAIRGAIDWIRGWKAAPTKAAPTGRSAILARMSVVVLLLLAGTVLAETLRPVNTYTIVARDPETGQLGVATQSHWFSVGATVRYGLAHHLLVVSGAGSAVTSNPLAADVALEKIQSGDGVNGRMWAVDLGAAVEWGDRLVLGLSVVNALGDVDWDTELLEFTQYLAAANFESTTVEERKISVADLSGEELERIGSTLRQSDSPLRLRLGGAYKVSDKLSLSADFVDCLGPGSAFDTQRQHLSSYVWDHYGDLDPREPKGDPQPGSVIRVLQQGLNLAGENRTGPIIDV